MAEQQYSYVGDSGQGKVPYRGVLSFSNVSISDKVEFGTVRITKSGIPMIPPSQPHSLQT